MPETPEVLVKVSRELLAELGEWSAPVQVRIVPGFQAGTYEMEARTVPKPEETD